MPVVSFTERPRMCLWGRSADTSPVESRPTATAHGARMAGFASFYDAHRGQGIGHSSRASLCPGLPGAADFWGFTRVYAITGRYVVSRMPHR